MTHNDIFNVLTDAISSAIRDEWLIARLNVQILTDGTDIEFDGTYLTATNELKVLDTDFPDEVTDVVRALYLLRKNANEPRANRLQIDLTAQGKFKAEFSWDQELQDEDDFFAAGGSARDWVALRDAKYGPPDVKE
ncbi:hypothetical protein F5984_04710 [Rudanella paleaurantiibacter]|uniref:DUF600 family protein n=1 Tax=Rudanella paleaurantiibacter TaxID=2614655 RepID=A0A7J5U5W4_9BACT|nr:hypothetical protein [Rudanella paleaurantiibacter]KAB7733234.1 hypothetical protein F5984_04710 [Rudanella paleaurantiibacter]